MMSNATTDPADVEALRPCVCLMRSNSIAIFVRVSQQRGWCYAEARCNCCGRATPRSSGRTPYLAQTSAFDAWQRGWVEERI
jgi:hypothetical protein